MISYNPSIHLALSDDSSDFPESEEDFSTLEITKDDHAIIKLKEWQTYYLKFYFDTDS